MGLMAGRKTFKILTTTSSVRHRHFTLPSQDISIVNCMIMITSARSCHALAGGDIRILLILILAVAAQSTLTAAFSFTIPKLNPANPALQELSQAQDGILVNLRLDVGQKEDSHLLADGLVVELSDDAIDKKGKNSVPLPGSSGPSPHLSSGAKSLRVLDTARFIGHDGTNHIDLQDGCWEMVSRYR